MHRSGDFVQFLHSTATLDVCGAAVCRHYVLELKLFRLPTLLSLRR
jgi:hypothetical protein